MPKKKAINQSNFKEEKTVILDEVKKNFPYSTILNEIEDIYVYSHYGIFATKKLEKVLAVLKPNKNLNENHLNELEKKLGIVFLNNGNQTEWKPDPDTLKIIIDERNPLTLQELEKKVNEENEFSLLTKEKLRENHPLANWFITKLNSFSGYRVHKLPSNDDGYCVVQEHFNGNETYSSKGRLLLCKGLINNELEVTEKVTNSLYNCTACGQCYGDYPKHDLEINQALIQARNEIANKNGCPISLRKPCENIKRDGNPMGLSAEDRTIWYEDIADEFALKNNNTLYWVGCNSSYRLPEVVESTAESLNKLEIDFGLLGENEGCCGIIFYLSGLWEEAKQHAKKTVQTIKENKIRTLVTGCAGCYFAFNHIYKNLGVDTPFTTFHTSQIYHKYLDNAKWKTNTQNVRLFWHDPCDLGRHSKVYDEPRLVLQSIPGVTLVEHNLTRGYTPCCGAGGGLLSYNYDVAEKVAETKIMYQIPSLNIDGIITGCPACIINLRKTSKELGIFVKDISEVVNNSL